MVLQIFVVGFLSVFAVFVQYQPTLTQKSVDRIKPNLGRHKTFIDAQDPYFRFHISCSILKQGAYIRQGECGLEPESVSGYRLRIRTVDPDYFRNLTGNSL